MYVTIFSESDFLNKEKTRDEELFRKTIGIPLLNTDLHSRGVERGVCEYGGYGRYASSVSYNGTTISKPTLPQREIYEILVCGNTNDFKKTKKKISAMQNTDLEKPINKEHWSSLYTDEVLEKFPNSDLYTCASGISPSGVVHFGNLREVITPYAVFEELKKRGKKARMIFSWDDFDRFRKVPKGIPEEFEQYIGLPLSKVPSPKPSYASYADYMEKQFIESTSQMGLEIDFIYQTKEYESGVYDESIKIALNKRKHIAKILFSFMTEKGKSNKGIVESDYIENYYPIALYSRFSGKDNTKILEYDGNNTLTYKCFDSGKTETINFTVDRIVKLGWKVDWAIRWEFEGVCFESGGSDHSSLGGSYDTSTAIAREIFNIEPPVYNGFNFVGIQGLGSKMSGSKGNSISPSDLLEIYSPELLKWIYYKNEPLKSFQLAFDSEVYRTYSEFDKQVQGIRKNPDLFSEYDKTSLTLSGIDIGDSQKKEPIPFRQAVAFGQIVQWNKEKLIHIIEALGYEYDHSTLSLRLHNARSWLETYNHNQIITLNKAPNTEYIKSLTAQEKEYVSRLKEEISQNLSMDIQDLNTLVYGIVKDGVSEEKELQKKQREFFKIIYNLLIGVGTGPRLSTFLWSIEDKEKLVTLLKVT